MKEPVSHSELPVELTWDLSKMYASVDDWEKDIRKIDPLVEKLQAFKGKLG